MKELVASLTTTDLISIHLTLAHPWEIIWTKRRKPAVDYAIHAHMNEQVISYKPVETKKKKNIRKEHLNQLSLHMQKDWES